MVKMCMVRRSKRNWNNVSNVRMMPSNPYELCIHMVLMKNQKISLQLQKILALYSPLFHAIINLDAKGEVETIENKYYQKKSFLI